MTATHTDCPKNRAWIGLCIVLFTYFMAYGELVFPSSITTALKQSLNIDDFKLGLLSSSFLWTYVLLQVPAGIILDLQPIKRTLIIVSATMALGCFFMAISNNYTLVVISRLMMGASSAFTFIACLTYSRIYFAPALFPLLTGVAEMMSGIGSLSFNISFSTLSKHLGWETVISICGIICLLTSICIALFVYQSPQFSKKKAYPIITQLKLMMRRKRIILAACYTGLSFAHIMVLTNVWDITFFSEFYHITTPQAVWLNATTLIGFSVGCPLLGYLARFFDKMKMMISCTLMQAILLMLAHHFHLPILLEVPTLFMLGLVTGSIVLVFTIVKSYVPKPVYGMTSGVINMFFGGTGIIVTPIVSYVYQRTQSDIAAIIPVIICSGLAVLCSFAMYIIDRNIPIRIHQRS